MIVSDNETQRTSSAILRWSGEATVAWHYLAAARSIQNGYVERFNGRMRDALLNEMLLLTLGQARDLDAPRLRHICGIRRRSRSARGAPLPVAGSYAPQPLGPLAYSRPPCLMRRWYEEVAEGSPSPPEGLEPDREQGSLPRWSQP